MWRRRVAAVRREPVAAVWRRPASVVRRQPVAAACAGGAAQVDRYRALTQDACPRIVAERDNPAGAFRSGSARAATCGIKSTSFLAVKPR
ncbi:hypothetical protein DFJ66_2309 [Saccharothrix variisporea]|uniref:Uncharacterized protein n=1 Tax=Saccharothrix variisporea TaxID=543527 RepID=A0A495X8B4_9PSEU|nr:hypothetical protein DFJ66_2309 [Saccharothrix variisporea]